MAAPFSPATRSTIYLSPHRSAGEGAPLPFPSSAPKTNLRHFPHRQLHGQWPSKIGPVLPQQLGPAELTELRRRNQWLQYAVAGFAVWSVAATYTAVSYQGDERAELHSQIKNLKAGLFDRQSQAEDILESAYRNVEGSRSFAEVSAQLALDEQIPVDPSGETFAVAQGLLAQPRSEAGADKASPDSEAVASQSAQPPKVKATPRSERGDSVAVALPPISQVFGLAPQYSVLASAPLAREPFAELPALFADRLPSTPLTAKLAPLSVAALSLSGKGAKTINIRQRSLRRAARSSRTLVAKRQAPRAKALKQTSGNVAITAYPGRARPSAASAAPAAAPSQSGHGEVAKLYLP